MLMITKLFSRWKNVILISVSIKVFLFLFAILNNKPDLKDIINIWSRWDAPHYLEIAKNGYLNQGEQSLFIVFYPLYPLLIKIIALIAQDYIFASILISLIACIIAAILLYELTLLDFSKRNAILAVWFFNIFPTSFFLQAGYTESLFLALSIGSVYFFRRESVAASAFLASLSSFTRINGLLLIPLFLAEVDFKNFNMKKILNIIYICYFSLFGFLSYLLTNYLFFGEPFYFVKPLTENWYKKLEWPWIGITNLINFIPNYQNPDFYIFLSEFLSIIFIILIIPFVYFKVRKSYAIYMVVNLLLFTSTSFILSTPRYTLILFPIYIYLATIKNKILLFLISCIFIFLLYHFSSLYTQGRWAF